MRHLLMIVAASILIGALGCADEAEEKRERLTYDNQLWGSQDKKPDCILGIAPPLTAPPVTKSPSSAAPVVQASAQSNQ